VIRIAHRFNSNQLLNHQSHGGINVAFSLQFYQKTSFRRLAKFGIDLLLIVLAYLLAFLLRFDGDVTAAHWGMYLITLPAVVIVFALFLWLFGIYRGMWKYSSIRDMIAITAVSFLGCILLCCFFWMVAQVFVLRGILAIFFILVVVFLGGARIAHRVWLPRFWFPRFLLPRSAWEQVPCAVVCPLRGGAVSRISQRKRFRDFITFFTPGLGEHFSVDA